MNPMKKIFLYLFALYLALLNTSSFAGVGGAGNTGDSSLQFNFARASALNLIQSISPQTLYEHNGRKNIRDFYTQCRQTLFLGTLKTRFELVDSISDGVSDQKQEFHALAQRLPNAVIRINRTELEKLQKSGTLNGPFLTAVVLHEVGHDCNLNNQIPVTADDSWDPLLNDFSNAMIQTSLSESTTRWVDLEFIEKVRTQNTVSWVDLSSRLRKQISARAIDYLGDWIYLKNKSTLSERPAPASQFMTSPETSLFSGWGQTELRLLSLSTQGVIENILKPSYQTSELSFRSPQGIRSLPNHLECHPVEEKIQCALSILESTLPEKFSFNQEIRFSLDFYGNLTLHSLRVIEESAFF